MSVGLRPSVLLMGSELLPFSAYPLLGHEPRLSPFWAGKWVRVGLGCCCCHYPVIKSVALHWHVLVQWACQVPVWLAKEGRNKDTGVQIKCGMPPAVREVQHFTSLNGTFQGPS